LHDTTRVAADRARIVGVPHERVAGHLVLLPALDDEPDAGPTVRLCVLRPDPFGRAVDDDVAPFEQVIERPGDIESGPLHGFRAFAVGPVQAEAVLLRRHPQAPVGGDIRDAGELHVLLADHRLGDPFADHAIPIHGDAKLVRWVHDSSPRIHHDVCTPQANADRTAVQSVPDNACA
jgi:hypothetical protein